MLERVPGGGDRDPPEVDGPYREEQRSRATQRDRALIVRYRQKGDESARDELVELYLPLAIRLAHRYRPSHEPGDDLVQVASLALVKAIDRFDPDSGSRLASYAVPTILGELKRHFRDSGWAVRVPRDLKELALRVSRTEDELVRRLGRSPTVPELSAELGITAEAVVDAQEAATALAAVPLEHGRSAEDEGVGEEILGGEDPGYARVEQRVMLGGLMAELTPREREILRLRFEEDLTQSEIGRRLGLSQMHVSRLIRHALARLQSAAS